MSLNLLPGRPRDARRGRQPGRSAAGRLPAGARRPGPITLVGEERARALPAAAAVQGAPRRDGDAASVALRTPASTPTPGSSSCSASGSPGDLPGRRGRHRADPSGGRELPFTRLALTVGAAAPTADACPAPTSTASATCATSTTPSTCAPAGDGPARRRRRRRLHRPRGGGRGPGPGQGRHRRGDGRPAGPARRRPRRLGVLPRRARAARHHRAAVQPRCTAVDGDATGRVTGVLLDGDVELPADLVVVGRRASSRAPSSPSSSGSRATAGSSSTGTPGPASRGRRGRRLHRAAQPDDRRGPGPARVGPERRGARHGVAAASLMGTLEPHTGRAVVLVEPGRPPAADRRPGRRLRPLRRPRGAGRRALLGPVLPRRAAARGRRRQHPGRLPGRPQGAHEGIALPADRAADARTPLKALLRRRQAAKIACTGASTSRLR